MVAALAGAALFSATPAQALDSSVCPHASSTRLLTAEVFDAPAKLWVYTSGGVTYVCFSVPGTLGKALIAGVVVVVRGGMPFDIDDLVTIDSGSCVYEWASTEDPAQFSIGSTGSNGLVATRAVCMTAGDRRVIVKARYEDWHLGYVEVWRDGNTYYATYDCTTSSSSTCATSARRIA